MQNFYVIGIDVSKKTLDVCAIVDGKIKKKVFSNSEIGFKILVEWISKLEIINPHICIESTGCYSEAVAEFFHKSKHKVSVVNPVQIKAFRTSKMVRQKTDSSDSEIIAKFCLQNNPTLWHPKSRDNKELHEISVRVDTLKVELNRLTNALESKYLNKVVQISIEKEMRFIKKLIEALEAESKRIFERNEKMKKQYDILTSIKGVGSKMALSILSDIPDISEFETAKQFATFVGVTPSHFQSETSVQGKSHISKIGSKRIRKILYMSVLVVKNRNKHFETFVQKLKKKGKAAKVIIVAVMRKLMYIFFGMLKNNTIFNENLAFSH